MSIDESAAKTAVDVIVIGGGAAGLSAALMLARVLARVRRSVVVVDAGSPRNAPADGVHGLLAREGMSPSEFMSRGRREAQSYGATIVNGEVVQVSGTMDAFTVTLRDGQVLHGRRLLIATGLVDELPDISGVRERWGRDVLHCPYCHGWEMRDRRIGVIASGPMSVHQALVFRQLTDHVTFFEQDHVLEASDRARFDALGIRVVPGEVVAVEVVEDRIAGVRLADDPARVEVDVVVVAPRMVARAELFAGIGIQLAEHPAGACIEADSFGVTSVPGVWAAGNASNLSAQVGAAAAAGALAAQHISAMLVMADADRAVADREVADREAGDARITPATRPADHAPAQTFDKAYWEQHWQARSASRPGPGKSVGHGAEHGGAAAPAYQHPVNPYLTRETRDLTPGTALDAGSGAGAEAMWLAASGWRVTATDISTTVLAQARAHAEATHPTEVNRRVEWVEADLERWVPGRTFDLVTTHYAHPTMPQLDFYEHLASWVAPGGTLLIVGHLHHHHHTHSHTHGEGHGHDGPPEKATSTAAAISARFDPIAWEVVTADEATRVVAVPDGRQVPLHDVVVRLRRREGLDSGDRPPVTD
ncbi:MAG TPA: bifunctional NAD(P)/FAD-dependent oxidoreductase/class I SAM-dependent methyltransferase [Thermomicrobiales bacterium]|jgi:thioredoxin reductase/protein-L-isoaspartate O-methyltransferase|nr:bifunctional NAD(P)/FAD-dependent oxidoreductase/class I SAM-dependent methyltransferase [Thermomicrobiales bacterium]